MTEPHRSSFCHAETTGPREHEGILYGRFCWELKLAWCNISRKPWLDEPTVAKLLDNVARKLRVTTLDT